MSDRTSFYPGAREVDRARAGQARRPAPGPRRRLDDADRGSAPDPEGSRAPLRLGDPDAEAAAGQAHPPEVHADQGARAAGGTRRPGLRRVGPLSRQHATRPPSRPGCCPASCSPRCGRSSRRSGRCPPSSSSAWVKNLDGPNVKKGGSKMRPRGGPHQRHRGFRKASGATRAVMVWCGSTEVYTQPADGAPDPRGVREGAQGQLPRHRAVHDLRLRGDRQRHSVRQRRAEPHRGHPRADRDGDGAGRARSPARISRPARR